MTEATLRAADLALRLREAGERFAGAVEELARIADELVALDADYRVAVVQSGKQDNRPPARELAVEILFGRLGSLRPYLPFVTQETADRAAEAIGRLGAAAPK